jgi:hypothetical protein
MNVNELIITILICISAAWSPQEVAVTSTKEYMFAQEIVP